MFDNKIISILSIILLFAIGCKDAPTRVSVSTPNKNTLNNPDLGLGHSIDDYWYHLNDEGIEVQFLYYNSFITRGINTILFPDRLNLYLDTLNFRTFPDYTVEINNEPVTIGYMVSLTPENIEDYSTLYPLDETNTLNQNWCNEMLVEYRGNCPDQIEVGFDYQFSSTGTGSIESDTQFSLPQYLAKVSTKEKTFIDSWKSVDTLFWDNNNERYEAIFSDQETREATLCSGVCDSARALTDNNYVIRNLKNYIVPDSMYYVEEDIFDSLIFVGIIDTNRYSVDDLMLIDRTEWERHDSIYYRSSSKTLQLDTTFIYTQINVPKDSPLYWINGDCNQNLTRDSSEVYFDYGPDFCPDSLETGPDTYIDSNGNNKWDNTEDLINDWNEDGEWTKAFCEVVDTDSDGDIIDEKPCNCLGDWRGGNDVVSTLENYNWISGSTDDPNGDNWRDCGVDGKCPGDPGYVTKENDTEGNGIWDRNEGFEENDPPMYNYIKQTNTGEYFIDKSNGVPDEPAEYFYDIDSDNEYDLTEPFDDRNCNEKWDDEESGDEGNGIWDDLETFYDEDNNGKWNDGDGNWHDAEPLYKISDRMEKFIVDYSNPSNPVPFTMLNDLTSVTLLFGTYSLTSTEGDSIHFRYNNFLTEDTVKSKYSQTFHDIDSIVTIYTNKIIEKSVPGIVDDYYITKTTWFQDIGKTSFIEDSFDNLEYGDNYGYEYHLFKSAENSDIIKMVHPIYFNYYGYFNTFDQLQLNTWRKESLEEETYIYTYDGRLRDGEYYYQDTTIITDVADYYIQDLYEVSYGDSVKVPFKKVRYNVTDTGVTECIAETGDTSNIYVDVIIDPPYNCPPADTFLTKTYKITRTKTMTMIGNGVEFGLRNTIWLGSAGPDNPLGIVKDQLEIRWSEPYWKEYGSDWKVISRLELSSLRKTEPELSRLGRIFQPIKHLSLNKLVDEENFHNEPYIVNSSYGIHTFELQNEK